MRRPPAVTVVIATRERPQLLRRSINSVVRQDYAGAISVIVVYDQTAPEDPDDLRRGDVNVTTMVNDRTAGLAGARNSGILAATTEWVAFCDDDDVWLPDKLRRQVTALQAEEGAEFCSCSIRVQFEGNLVDRRAGASRIQHADLLQSRMAMVHSSTFVIRRAALLDGIGLIDEAIPGSQNEDWDLVLRASERRPLVHVDVPLVEVLWGSTSLFAERWQTKIDSLEWMLSRHPAIRTSPRGAARVYGQLAFAHAVLGNRRETVRWVGRSLRARWCEPRAFLALAVSARATSGEAVLRMLHQRGRGV